LLFRYRARNWPGTLSAGERERWDAYRRARLAPGSSLSEYSFESFDAELAALRDSHGGDAARLALLDKLQQWRHALEAGL
jgi:exodeoxyribonuclease-1